MTQSIQRLHRPRDTNQLAKLIVDIATGHKKDERSSSKDGRFVESGSRGGKARAASLSAEKRSKIASEAAKSRWKKK